MDSQSGYSLPIIYEQFDSKKKAHWIDRGYLFDFLYSIMGKGKRLLDFGPGDGWPSLIIAPYTREVIGLDASPRRIEICSKNAEKLGVNNVKFIKYNAGESLPFADNYFDGIMAASSIEQTPNPLIILKELYRVLKPEGRIRIRYEALNNYKSGKEKDFWVAELNKNKSKLVFFNRFIDKEYVVQYGITLSLPKEKIIKILTGDCKNLSYENINISTMKSLESYIENVQKCKTIHPSGKTFVKWLKEMGFKSVVPYHNGGIAAAELYEQYRENDIRNLSSVDKIIKSVVKIVIKLKAPIEMNPMITAVK